MLSTLHQHEWRDVASFPSLMSEVIELAEFERTRREIEHRQETIQAQKRQIESFAQQRMELHQVASSIETFCEQVRTG